MCMDTQALACMSQVSAPASSCQTVAGLGGQEADWLGEQTGVNTITFYRHTQWHICTHTHTHSLLNPWNVGQMAQRLHPKPITNDFFSVNFTSMHSMRCARSHNALLVQYSWLWEQTCKTPSLRHNTQHDRCCSHVLTFKKKHKTHTDAVTHTSWVIWWRK